MQKVFHMTSRGAMFGAGATAYSKPVVVGGSKSDGASSTCMSELPSNQSVWPSMNVVLTKLLAELPLYLRSPKQVALCFVSMRKVLECAL